MSGVRPNTVDYAKWDLLDTSDEEEATPVGRRGAAPGVSPPAGKSGLDIAAAAKAADARLADELVALRAELAGLVLEPHEGDADAAALDTLRGLVAKSITTLRRPPANSTAYRGEAFRVRTDVKCLLASRRESKEWRAAAGEDWSDKVQQLFDAVSADDAETALRVLAGAGLSAATASSGRGFGDCVLHLAADRDAPRCCAAFVAAGAPLEARDVFADTPLLAAARAFSASAVRALLEGGACHSATNATRSTALHLLCLSASPGEVERPRGRTRCCAALLRAGADVNAPTGHECETPPMFAIQFGQLAVLKVMLACPALHWRAKCAPPSPTQPPRGLLAVALAPPAQSHACFPVMRQAVVEAAAEARCPGSADVDDLFGLRSSPRAPRLADVVVTWNGMRVGKLCPPSDPLCARDTPCVLQRTDKLLYRSGPPLPGPPGLAPRCRVLRYADGASVVLVNEVPPSEHIAPERAELSPAACVAAFLGSTHPRLGGDSPAKALGGSPELVRGIAARVLEPPPRWAGCAATCAASRRCPCAARGAPCFSACHLECVSGGNPVNAAAARGLSDCAKDHLRAVAALSPKSLAARMPLACIEKWAGKLETTGGARRSPGGACHWHASGPPGTVPIRAILGPSGEACEGCGDEGAQFFSVCLNRVRRLIRTVLSFPG